MTKSDYIVQFHQNNKTLSKLQFAFERTIIFLRRFALKYTPNNCSRRMAALPRTMTSLI